MSPIYKASEAKEGGWAQVRAALTKFEGDVVSAESGQWGGTLVDDNGNPTQPREFLEIKVSNVHVLEVTEDLTMDIEGQDYNFRENCSMNTGSFWVDEFLASADKFKLLLPDGLTGKRIIWEKKTKLAKNPKFNSTNYVIAGIAKGGAPVVVKPKTATPTPTTSTATVGTPVEEPAQADPMQIALDLAVGKTETQFRSAIALHPMFANSPLLSMAKAGMITASLVKDGKLVEVMEGTKKVYKKV